MASQQTANFVDRFLYALGTSRFGEIDRKLWKNQKAVSMSCLGQRENTGFPAIYELLEYTQAFWNVNAESRHLY
ncbi:hypothetical protein [Pseudovibrio ascidiaceicola]|uniref:hypothetical protein n=1 Tax=Pseudovibrio ascidiaceicola TaxID=285279 RepID=UPI001AD8E219|nr:hypothetical protein [Pseudovibrio ascidiaceicola]